MQLKELVLAYCRTPEARACALSTRRNRQRAFDRLLVRFGDIDIKILDERGTRTKLYDWRDTFVEAPHEGNQTMMYVAALFNWAVDRGHCRDNPARGLKKLGKSSSRSEKIWLAGQAKAFMRAADLPVGEVFLTSLWTGLALCDILALTTANFDEGWLETRRRKTGAVVSIPYYLSDPLVQHLTPLVNYSWAAGAPIFRSYRGLPWSERNYNIAFNAAKQRAGLGAEDLKFHDLRGTFVTGLLEAGCTDAEVASLTGHALAGGSIKNYAARTRPLAEAAYGKLVEGAYGTKFDLGLAVQVRQEGAEPRSFAGLQVSV